MTTIRAFIGDLIQQLNRARLMADVTSAEIAHIYARHEYLKGFPIPKMKVQNIELEFNFAIAEEGKVDASRYEYLAELLSRHADFFSDDEKDDIGRILKSWKRDSAMEVPILIGARELGELESHQIHTMKISLSAADMKWVVHKDGKDKTFILSP